MYHNFFIHSSVDGHLGCFHVLAIVNSDAMKMGYMCLIQFWLPQGICLRVGLLGHMVVLFLVFKEISIPKEHCLFSTPSPAFIVCRLSHDGHSDWCDVTSHCSFDLRFSNN